MLAFKVCCGIFPIFSCLISNWVWLEDNVEMQTPALTRYAANRCRGWVKTMIQFQLANKRIEGIRRVRGGGGARFAGDLN